MHIQQHQLGRVAGVGALQGLMRAACKGHGAAPALQQRARGGAGLRVIFDVPRHAALQRDIVLPRWGAGAHGGLQRSGIAQRHGHPKHAAFAQRGAQANLVAQQLAQPLHNRQPQAGAAVIGMAFIQAAKLLKDFALQAGRNPRALVVYLNAHLCAHAAAAHHDAALAAVANGVGDKVLQDAAQ